MSTQYIEVPITEENREHLRDEYGLKDEYIDWFLKETEKVEGGFVLVVAIDDFEIMVKSEVLK